LRFSGNVAQQADHCRQDDYAKHAHGVSSKR
jgi:hypothetical protein